MSILSIGGVLSLGAPGGATTPATILGADLDRWLRRGVGLFTDAGITAAVSNGAQIYRWADQSGNAKHYDQTTSANRPTLDTGTTHLGSPMISCDATVSGGQFWTGPTLNGMTEAECFIVLKLRTQPPASGAKTGLFANYGVDNFETDYPFTDGNGYITFGGQGGRQSIGSLAGFTLTTTHVLSLRTYAASLGAANNPNNNWHVQINSTVAYNDTGVLGTTVSPPAGTVELGRSNSGVKGDLWFAEHVVSKRVLTPTERTAMITYLTT